MEFLSEGIAVFRKVFVRSEEVIDLAENSSWRQGTAGPKVNPNLRITDIHDLDKDTELHQELLDTFVDGINEYRTKHPTLNITNGEHLRIARYQEGGFYAPHVDTNGAARVLSGVLYLNSDFEGGELKFPSQDITIKPEEGMLVLFPSNFLFIHESTPITEGCKYATIGWFS